jgi:hypothetical protein
VTFQQSKRVPNNTAYDVGPILTKKNNLKIVPTKTADILLSGTVFIIV